MEEQNTEMLEHNNPLHVTPRTLGTGRGDKRLVCGAGGSLGDAASCAEPLHLASRPPPRPPAAGRAPRPRPRLRHPPQPRHPGGVSAEKTGKEDHK